MLYRVCRALLTGFLRLCYRFQVFGAEHLPETGPVIVVCNHANFIDPIVVGCSLQKRQVCFMAKEELFRIPLLGGLIRRFGAFPVKRGTGDRGAFRAARSVLAAGKVVGMFPEGKRYRDGKIHPLKPGAAMLAVESGAQVLPMVVTGTHHLKLFRFPRIKAFVGPALKLEATGDKKETVRQGTEQIFTSLLELWEKAEAAVAEWAKL
ncbi:MAG: 1-acyl-sn-glycerol-3-phosphate acyltransferase [Firmicutes bacterium]|nr:1-acyl-sn-glycerol-3-phosphate acyltransferase [Bacillota bacterium]